MILGTLNEGETTDGCEDKRMEGAADLAVCRFAADCDVMSSRSKQRLRDSMTSSIPDHRKVERHRREMTAKFWNDQ